MIRGSQETTKDGGGSCHRSLVAQMEAVDQQTEVSEHLRACFKDLHLFGYPAGSGL